MRDYHVHSNYSDGRLLFQMVSAAERAGLDGVGIADHCTITDREGRHIDRDEYGFTLDVTYERRRRGIEQMRERFDVTVYDAVEMDYDPRDEDVIADFLAEAEFDYAIGSVHELDGENVHVTPHYSGRADGELDALVDRYFEKLVALAESELFDIAAHPDLVERTEPLRGRATRDHYERAARAFAESRTVPEVNAGRALTDSGVVHPSEEFLDVLGEYDVAVTVGTDSHFPDEIAPRLEHLEDRLDEHGLEPVAPPSLSE